MTADRSGTGFTHRPADYQPAMNRPLSWRAAIAGFGPMFAAVALAQASGAATATAIGGTYRTA
jgi:hypothetical protein